MKELLIASVAFALFILCPRMAGMTKVISDAAHVELVKVVVFGTLISLPLIIAMALVFVRYGLVAALALCVITDFAAAFAMREINMKAGVETLIIALFVLLGVKSWIANFPFQFSAFIETLIVFIILPFLLATATRLVLRKIKSREWTNALFDTVFSPIQLFSLAIVIFAMFAGQTKIIIDNFNTLSLVPPRQGILH